MLIALLSSFMTAVSNIFWKKSLGYGVGWKVHDLIPYVFWVILSLYFLYVSFEGTIFDPTLMIVIFWIMIVAIFRTQFAQKIYQEEKMSVLLPYTNINKIVVIVCSFFLFSDVSLTSLFITILAIVIIILFSIDFKNHRIPKNTRTLIVLEFLIAGDILLWGWIIIHYSEVHYYIACVIWWIIILSLLSLAWGQFKTLKGQPKSFWTSRLLWWIGWISWFLSLTIIKSLGLSISILLSFLWIGVTLILWYFILKDTPSKKDLILTAIVTILVGLGFYFK